MVAFMSVSHIGLILSRIISFLFRGIIGGMIYIISHGLISSGLFFIVNIFYQRIYSRRLLKLKGGNSFIPHISLLSFILIVRNLALPPTLSFISEIYLIFSIMSYSILRTLIIFLIVIIRRTYIIHLYLSIFHGNEHLIRIGPSGDCVERLSLLSHFIPLLILILLF
jgi:NADH:ubiquinone oxidoreductase subunit 4 (subunit M)